MLKRPDPDRQLLGKFFPIVGNNYPTQVPYYNRHFYWGLLKHRTGKF